MHKLLREQLKRHDLEKFWQERDLEKLVDGLEHLLRSVDQSYFMFEEKNNQLQESVDYNSEEMAEKWEKMIGLVTQRDQTLSMVNVQNELLKEYMGSTSFQEIMNKLLARVMVETATDAGSIHLVDHKKEYLSLLVANNLDEESAWIQKIPLGKNWGSQGTAAYIKEDTFVANVKRDERFKELRENHPELINELPFLSSWSTPIVDGHGELLGVFTLFKEGEVVPKSQKVRFLHMASQLSSVFIEKEELHMEQEAAKEKIIHSSKLAVLGEMAGNIAHEINNPLSIIYGLAGKMKIMHKKNLLTGEEVEKLADKFNGTVERIKNIVTALRIFSRDDAESPKEFHSLQNIINSSLAICQEKMKNSGTIITQVVPEEPVPIYCNEVQINQVIVNFLSNAYDAIENTKDPWITLKIEDQKDWIALYITDSGKGIPLALQEKIMQPLFTTKEPGKGTGIGLSLSNQIIKEHQGQITINNDSPNTEFVLGFPKIKQKFKKAG